MSTQSHLASLGVTIEQANEFILSHVNEPFAIFVAALENGITTAMLSDITGFSTDAIKNYFNSFGIAISMLDIESNSGGGDSTPPTSLSSLNNFIALNENTGILSNEALRESVFAVGDVFGGLNFTYKTGFLPPYHKYDSSPSDGIFTPEELGDMTAHLGNLPATGETMESLFFGTIINELKAIDAEEIQQISDFYDGVQFFYAPEDGTPAGDLFTEIFSTPTENPYFSDEQIVDIAAEIGNLYQLDILDNSDGVGLGHYTAAMLLDHILL